MNKQIEQMHRAHVQWRADMGSLLNPDGTEAFPLPDTERCVYYIAEEAGELLAEYMSLKDEEGQYMRRNDGKGSKVVEERNHVMMMCSSYFMARGHDYPHRVNVRTYNPSNVASTIFQLSGHAISDIETGPNFISMEHTIALIWTYCLMLNVLGQDICQSFEESLAERRRMVEAKLAVH